MRFDATLRPEQYGSVRIQRDHYDYNWLKIKRWLEEDHAGQYRRCYHHGMNEQFKQHELVEVEFIFTDKNTAFDFKMSFC